MEVQVFDPVYGAEDPKLRPHEVFMVEGSDRGLRIQPELLGSVAFGDVQALSIFRSSEYGEEKSFLLLVAKSAVRPLLVEAQLIRYTDFPIRACETLAESLRQAVLYFCQKAGRMVMDRSTGHFLRGGGSPPRLETSILAVATAIRQVLPSGPSSPPDPTPRPPAPAPPSTPGPIPGFEAEAFRPALATPAAAGIDPGPLPFGSPQLQPDAPVASVPFGAAPPDSWSEAPSSPAGGGAVPGAAPRRPEAADAGHSDWEAFSYPVRGLSFLVLVVFVAFTVVSVVLRHNYPSTGTVVALNAVAAWFLPPVMFGIVRDTALGDNTLAELPSFFDLSPRLGDLVSYLLVALVPALAAWGGRELIVNAATSLEMPLGLIVAIASQALLGLLLFALWMIALGAAAVYNDVTIPLRLDLHFRALVRCWQPLLGIFARLFAFTFLIVCFIVVYMLFVRQPDTGSISGLILASLPAFALAGYILIDSCHLVGLLFRRHESTLSAIYLYK